MGFFGGEHTWFENTWVVSLRYLLQRLRGSFIYESDQTSGGEVWEVLHFRSRRTEEAGFRIMPHFLLPGGRLLCPISLGN